MKIKLTLIIVIFVLSMFVLGIGGCEKQEQVKGSISKNEVEIRGFSFNPGEVTISSGTSVKWINFDSVKHTITADDKSFNLNINPGETIEKTFDSTGEYSYHCAIHPSMKGKIIVK